MTPESVGVTKSSLVMGKHSGRNAFKDKKDGASGDTIVENPNEQGGQRKQPKKKKKKRK